MTPFATVLDFLFLYPNVISAINLGGEGEIPGVLNQQRPAVLLATWASCIGGLNLEQLTQQGHDFLICDNRRIPLRDRSIDIVITNSVPIDIVSLGQPGIQSSEIYRILASGGIWFHDQVVRHVQP